MDQKRVLWIVAAAGLFLLVVIGTAFILYSPVLQKSPSFDSLQANGDIWIQKTENSINVAVDSQNIKESITPPVVVEENKQTTNSDIRNQEDQSTQKLVTVISENTNVYAQGTTTIDLNEIAKNNTTIQSNNNATQNISNQSATEEIKSSIKQVEPKKSTETVKPVKKQQAPTKKVDTAKKSTSAVKQTYKITDQFWVQVASFTSKQNAEEARVALNQEKITGEIFTFKDAKGVVYYRLRVGPYTTKSEADYWHSRIKLIDQFTKTSSYVVNSTGTTIK